jgi:hypothetical protein
MGSEGRDGCSTRHDEKFKFEDEKLLLMKEIGAPVLMADECVCEGKRPGQAV